MDDIFYMEKALAKAVLAAKKGEVPVGAVIEKDGLIVGSGYNMRESKKNALLHAELTAINNACRKLNAWRLEGCTLYVTLEPCPMCAGAVINSRLGRVVFGAYDKKAGAYGGVTDLSAFPFNHKYTVEGGVLEDKCAGLLSDFFKKLRTKGEFFNG